MIKDLTEGSNHPLYLATRSPSGSTGRSRSFVCLSKRSSGFGFTEKDENRFSNLAAIDSHTLDEL